MTLNELYVEVEFFLYGLKHKVYSYDEIQKDVNKYQSYLNELYNLDVNSKIAFKSYILCRDKTTYTELRQKTKKLLNYITPPDQ